MATVASHKRLYTYYQWDGVDNHTYHREFLSFVETIETYGGLGAVGVIPVFLNDKIIELHKQGLIADANAPTNDERALAIDAVHEEYLTALMISGANRERFSLLRTDLQNQYGYGNDLYPKTTDQCLSLLNRWTVSTPRSKRPDASGTTATTPIKKEEDEALVFAQDGTKPSGGDTAKRTGKDSRRPKSSSSSTSSSSGRITNVQCKTCGCMGHTSHVCPDSKRPLEQIHAMDADDASEESDASSYHITYDSRDRDGVFRVFTDNGVVEFMSTDTGLHVLNLRDNPEAAYLLATHVSDTAPSPIQTPPDHQLHVNTVRDNYHGYTKTQVANDIFGPDLATIRGKTVRHSPERVVTDYVEIPRDFIEKHYRVTIVADVMFVNSILLINLLHFIVMWLNNFPTTTGTCWSPREIILRHRLDYKHHCRAPFGAYCEVHEDHDKELNSMKTLIDRVSKLAKISGVLKDLIFADRHRQPYTWPDNPPDSLDDTPIGAYPDLPAEFPGVILDRSPPGVTPNVDTNASDQEDWAALADAALDNADLDLSPPPSPEIIDLSSDGDDDPSPIPSSLRQTLKYIPKLEPTSLPPTPPPLADLPISRYPSCARAPPKRLAEYHLYAMMADESKRPPSYPYRNANAIFSQSTIFAHEQRDVATCDIPGAFLHADNPDYVLMRLDGILAELMVKVAPSIYRKTCPFGSRRGTTTSAGGGKVNISVWAGNYFGLSNVRKSPPPDSWASDPENDVAILHIVISPGGEPILPRANSDGVNRSLYLIEGHERERACLDMDSTKDVLIVQGRPIGEPVATSHGPFVMNTYAEIDDAIADYRRTGFGGWPWSREDVVFPREKGRFAVINGVETRPPTKTIGKKVDPESVRRRARLQTSRTSWE
ncbi:hypothetical protein ACHAXA_003266 [Cyclostephanos tholiformis]|uniref:Cadherin domain-containing protein n=1 Tax=Cyclostephanos tholiformis TaxID=382380 RepID=A0ABD3SB03_9STRA